MWILPFLMAMTAGTMEGSTESNIEKNSVKGGETPTACPCGKYRARWHHLMDGESSWLYSLSESTEHKENPRHGPLDNAFDVSTAYASTEESSSSEELEDHKKTHRYRAKHKRFNCKCLEPFQKAKE